MEKGPRFVPTKKEIKKTDCIGGITLGWAGRGGVEDNDSRTEERRLWAGRSAGGHLLRAPQDRQ